MQATIVAWLDRVGATAFAVAAWTFVVLNGVVLLALLRRRDRGLVNRWTPRLLAADLLLAAVGIGVPLVTLATRTAIVMLAPSARVIALPFGGDARGDDAPARR